LALSDPALALITFFTLAPMIVSFSPLQLRPTQTFALSNTSIEASSSIKPAFSVAELETLLNRVSFGSQGESSSTL